MAAPWGWAGKVFRDFVETNVSVIDFEEKLHRALQPDMQASQAGGLNKVVVIEIAQVGVFKPRHQKSSADGMRL